MSSPGLSAYQIAVLRGFRGSETEWLDSLKGREGRSIKGDKGDKGDKADPGPSAYEVARANGFIGTQAAWLDSLRGRPGDPGKKGDPGLPAALPPKPKKWTGEVFRDDADKLASAVITADTGSTWRASFQRNGMDGQIDEFVLIAI